MKKILVIIFVLFISSMNFAQWGTSAIKLGYFSSSATDRARHDHAAALPGAAAPFARAVSIRDARLEPGRPRPPGDLHVPPLRLPLLHGAGGRRPRHPAHGPCLRGEGEPSAFRCLRSSVLHGVGGSRRANTV